MSRSSRSRARRSSSVYITSDANLDSTPADKLFHVKNLGAPLKEEEPDLESETEDNEDKMRVIRERDEYLVEVESLRKQLADANGDIDTLLEENVR